MFERLWEQFQARGYLAVSRGHPLAKIAFKNGLEHGIAVPILLDDKVSNTRERSHGFLLYRMGVKHCQCRAIAHCAAVGANIVGCGNRHRDIAAASACRPCTHSFVDDNVTYPIDYEGPSRRWCSPGDKVGNKGASALAYGDFANFL